VVEWGEMWSGVGCGCTVVEGFGGGGGWLEGRSERRVLLLKRKCICKTDDEIAGNIGLIPLPPCHPPTAYMDVVAK